MKYYLLLVIILFATCKKNDTDPRIVTPPPPPAPGPSITTIDPRSGDYKTTITITGKHFLNSLAGNQVTINGKAATVLAATETTITATVPERSGTGSVQVSNINGAATGDMFTYIPTIFIGGGETEVSLPAAKYWENGAATTLSDTGYVNALVVQGEDVFAGGYSTLPDMTNAATYWKNGVKTILPTNLLFYGSVLSMFVLGNDIYAAGTAIDPTAHINVGVYWKNSVMTSLDNPSSNAAYSVMPSGADIYVASTTWGDDGYAKLWKNGVLGNVSNSGVVRGAALALYVAGTDVYVGGNEFKAGGYAATYWKNGQAVPLTDGVGVAFVSSLFVSGNDIYAAGNDGLRAMYWKNGVGVPLSDSVNNTLAKSIQVLGDDVYVAGYETVGGHDIAVYWKNGAKFQLTDGSKNAEATCIFVR